MLPNFPKFRNFRAYSRSNDHFEVRFRNACTSEKQILADQFSFSQPRVQIFSTTLNLAHPLLYYTFLQPCFWPCLFFLFLSFYPGWNEKTKLVATTKVYLCLCISIPFRDIVSVWERDSLEEKLAFYLACTTWLKLFRFFACCSQS